MLDRTNKFWFKGPSKTLAQIWKLLNLWITHLCNSKLVGHRLIKCNVGLLIWARVEILSCIPRRIQLSRQNKLHWIPSEELTRRPGKWLSLLSAKDKLQLTQELGPLAALSMRKSLSSLRRWGRTNLISSSKLHRTSTSLSSLMTTLDFQQLFNKTIFHRINLQSMVDNLRLYQEKFKCSKWIWMLVVSIKKSSHQAIKITLFKRTYPLTIEDHPQIKVISQPLRTAKQHTGRTSKYLHLFQAKLQPLNRLIRWLVIYSTVFLKIKEI